MKHWRMTDWLAGLASVLAVSGFFLPWAKVGAGFDPKLVTLAESIEQSTATRLGPGDMVGFAPSQWAGATHEPLTGASGLRLFFELRDETGMTPGLRYFISHFLGERPFPEKAYLILALPLAILGPFCLGLWVWRTPKAHVALGSVLLLEYLGLRWLVAVTEASRLAVDLRLGLGFWFTVFSALLAASVFLLRSVFPNSRVI